MDREGGAVWLHRQLMSSAVWTLPDAQFKVFVGLLLSANWKDKTVAILGQPRTIRRGQALISQRQIAERCGVSRGAVERAMETLQALDVITTEQGTPGHKSSHNPTVVTIVNYEKYQSAIGDDQAKEQAKDGPTTGPKTGRRQGLSEEGKKERREQQDLLGAPAPTLSPQGKAYVHWKENVWWRLSTAVCPDLGKGEAVQLARLCKQYGVDGVKAAMDEAVKRLEAGGNDGDYLRRNLTLGFFVSGSQFPKFLPRTAPVSALPILSSTAARAPAPAEAFGDGGFVKVR
jgi:hypothetical protein